MPIIKIISNPYQKKIAFKRFDEAAEVWIDITIENYPNSKLLRDKLIKGFFPFKVKDIIDEIIAEYHINNDKIEIIFEGTEDEYKELAELCKSEEYAETIKLSKSECYLENARDILPEINDLYNDNIRPLINHSVTDYEKVSKEIDKYSDASNDIIPICVLGNYSAGKSTFINALIGSEILPSGAEPVTAKIYRIKQSEFTDRAYIQLRYDQDPVKIKFDENSFKIQLGSNALTEQLSSELKEIENGSITAYVNKALEVINNFDTKNAEDKVSEVIEIEVPFVSGLWRETTRQFYIFDTPGSNSASNDKHLRVLKDAMSSLSNGLPIFISEFDALDSTDNVNLYKEIEKMDEIDDRFTMIVVNKADTAELDKGGFSKDKEERILAQAIPKNLYKGGIYFVSSIIGLGAKSNGEFIDDHYAELFDEKHTKFEDASSRFYKTLYKYNIMPEQLKNNSLKNAEGVSDLLFANSGLYTIEREIQTFAGKYSSYNKCQQARLYLNQAIEIVQEDVKTAKTKREEKKQEMNNELEENKKQLIVKIESTSTDSQAEFNDTYNSYMITLSREADDDFSADEIKAQEEEIKSSKKEDNSYDAREAAAKKAAAKILSNFKKNAQNVFSKDGLQAIKTLGKDFIDDIKDTTENIDVFLDTKKNINKETAEKLLKDVTDEFNTRFEKAQTTLDEKSKAFWEEKTQALKDLLLVIVTGTTALDEEQRAELAEIIMTYDNIVFETHPAEKLLREDFKKGIKFGDFVLCEFDKIDINKLAERYSTEMTRKINEIRNTIQGSHRKSFKDWNDSLVSTLRDNIVKYSPMLTAKAQEIQQEEKKISELEAKLNEFAVYTKMIAEMMEWKTF